MLVGLRGDPSLTAGPNAGRAMGLVLDLSADRALGTVRISVPMHMRQANGVVDLEIKFQQTRDSHQSQAQLNNKQNATDALSNLLLSSTIISQAIANLSMVVPRPVRGDAGLATPSQERSRLRRCDLPAAQLVARPDASSSQR